MDSIETAVQGIKNGEVNLFEEIIEKFQQKLFRYCYHMLGDIHEAEDAVQEAFIKAYEKICSYNKSVSFSAWLYKITYNHCINVIHRKRLIQFLPFLEETVVSNTGIENRLEESEFSEVLNKGLKKLTSTDRSIIILRTLEERSYEELGTILNIKPATIRKKYERARKKLKRFLIQVKGGAGNEEFATN